MPPNIDQDLVNLFCPERPLRRSHSKPPHATLLLHRIQPRWQSRQFQLTLLYWTILLRYQAQGPERGGVRLISQIGHIDEDILKRSDLVSETLDVFLGVLDVYVVSTVQIEDLT